VEVLVQSALSGAGCQVGATADSRAFEHAVSGRAETESTSRSEIETHPIDVEVSNAIVLPSGLQARLYGEYPKSV
jgi:anti-sigma factor RsiW